LGEACSHIAALLFKFEAIGRLRVNSNSKTSEACTWNWSFRKKVLYHALIKSVSSFTFITSLENKYEHNRNEENQK
jgi:hypothetical protein